MIKGSLQISIPILSVFGQKIDKSKMGSDPKSGGPKPLFNTVLLGTTQVSLPNGISFRPMALAWCMSVTDDIRTYIQTDHARRAVTSATIGRIADACSDVA